MSVNPNAWPPYSFVQDGGAETAPSCYPDQATCLPLSNWYNLNCEVQLDGTAPLALLASLTDGNSKIYLSPVATDFPCDYSIQQVKEGFAPLTFKLHYAAIGDFLSLYDPGTAANSVIVYFDGSGSTDGDMDSVSTENNTIAVPVGSCFKFAIVWDVYNGSQLMCRYNYGCTNCFTRIDAGSCYTSVLKYSNSDDSFGFHYTGPGVNFVNMVELPMYLRDPKMENDQKVYTRSDGTIVKLYERKEEVYELETDMMPYIWHKALDIALSHDRVLITNPNATDFDPLNTATQFVKKDNYEIEYNKAPLSALGKGKCKLSNAMPVHLVNNNCS